MEPPQRGRPSPATQVLAASLAMGLPQEDLEWLWRALKERAEEGRPGALGGWASVLGGYRDACEPEGDAGQKEGASPHLPRRDPMRPEA